MSAQKPKTVDDYIKAFPAEAHAKFAELRALIKAAIPEAEERIWYNVPFYFYRGELIGLSVHKAHISFGYGSGVLEEKDRKALEAEGYKTGKGTFQIGFAQTLPAAAIKKIIAAKAKLNETKSAGN